MKSTQYSEKTLDHFRNPRNVGVLEGNDVAVGRVGNPTCGDLMEVFIKVKNVDGVDIIEDAKFRTFGCGSAIATSSMTTEMVKGMSLDEALEITRDDVATELDGLPPIKMHCSNLAADALHEAIKNYQAAVEKEIELPEDVPSAPSCIIGREEFLDRGVYHSVIMDIDEFEDKRTLVLHTGDESIDMALELTSVTERVILLTPAEMIHTTEELAEELANSSVKVLTQSRLLEVRGEFEVERVLVKNLDEDEDYELHVDAVVIID